MQDQDGAGAGRHLLEGALAVGAEDGGAGDFGAVHEAVHGVVAGLVAHLVGEGDAGMAADPLGDALEGPIARGVSEVDGSEVGVDYGGPHLQDQKTAFENSLLHRVILGVIVLSLHAAGR